MFRRIWITSLMVVGLALTLLAPAGAAFAAEASGTGVLKARGAGTALIEGSGTVYITRGSGTVYVSGAERILTEGRGRRAQLDDGTVVLTGYTGAITIIGEEMTVRIIGGAIGLRAEGTGSVTLTGKGSYTVGNETSGTWTKAGVVVGY